MPDVTLILGGARSGKSALAENLANRSGRPVIFLATGTAGDAEMAERIQRHRATRPAAWRTIESPIDLVSPLRTRARPGDLLLIDCLTLWTSNRILFRLGTDRDPEAVALREWSEMEADLIQEVGELIGAARIAGVELILVSNEVGMGIVPPYPLGRHFRDALGQVNQAAAGQADSVVLMIAGIPVDLRQLAPTELLRRET